MSINMNRLGTVRRAVRRACERGDFFEAHRLASRYALATERRVFRYIHYGYADLCHTVRLDGDTFSYERPFGKGWNSLPDWEDFRRAVGLPYN